MAAGEAALDGLVRARQEIGVAAHDPGLDRGVRERAQDRRRARREVDRLLQQIGRGLHVAAPEPAQLGAGAQVEIDRARIGGALGGRRARRQRRRDAAAEVLGRGEDLGLAALAAVRPDLEAIGHADQPRRDAQAARRAAQRRDDDVIDLERAAELARIDPGVRPHHAGRPDPQGPGRRQRVDQVVEQAVREVLVAGRAGDRQHGHRGARDRERARRRVGGDHRRQRPDRRRRPARRRRCAQRGRRRRRRARPDPGQRGARGHPPARRRRIVLVVVRRGEPGARRDRLTDDHRARRPLRSIDPDAALDHLDEPRRQPPGERSRRLRRLRHRDRDRVVARPRPRAGRQLVQHHAEREHIGALIDLLSRQLLGRHVARRADQRPDLRDPDLVAAARDPEIGDHDAIRPPLDHHVVRLEVAVDHPRLVRRRQPGAQLDRQTAQPPPRHRRAELAGQRRAVDQLHRQEPVGAVLTDVEHPRHVAVLDPPGQLDLAAEPLDRVVGQPAAQHLERDPLVELGVERLVDPPHRPRPEPAHDAIAPRHQPAVVERGGHRGPVAARQVRDGVVVAADRHVSRSLASWLTLLAGIASASTAAASRRCHRRTWPSCQSSRLVGRHTPKTPGQRNSTPTRRSAFSDPFHCLTIRSRS